MENNTADIWERTKKVLKMQIEESEYNSWILNLKPVDMDDNYFLFDVDNLFIKDRIDKTLKEDIIRAIEIVEPKVNKIEIRVEEKMVQKEFF